MAAMTSAFDLRSAAGWFRLIALAEAVSWVGLLIGMYYKYLGTPRTEIGVKVFGMTHGLIFIAFVVAGLLVGIAFKWPAGTLVAGVAGEHRATVQCDLPHMGRQDRPNGACGGNPGGRATGTTSTRNNVTDLWA